MRLAASSFARRIAALTAATLLASACMVGPNYERPSAPTPAKFKAAEGWVDAEPADALDRGPWWSLFNDPPLDALAARVEVSNQNVAAATAAYAQARALVREQRASLFPQITLDAGASRAGTGLGGDAQASSNYRIAIGAGVGTRRVGPTAAGCRKRRRERAGQRSRSRVGATFGARRARCELLRRAANRRRARAAGRNNRRLSEVARDHEKPLRRRRHREDRRPAS